MQNLKSQNNLINFDPRRIAQQKSEREQLHKMNIAAELLISRSVGIYYADIMTDIDTDLYASSRSLLSWINDFNRNIKGKKSSRDGIISLYKERFPEDFDFHTDFGLHAWNAYNLPRYIHFAGAMLTDKAYAGKAASTYKQSFVNDDWFWKMIAVSGIKLLERQVESSGIIHSKAASEVLKMNKMTRQLLDKTGSIIGRSTKNHDAESLKDELKTLVMDHYKFMQRSIQKEIEHYSEEREALAEYQDYLNESLLDARDNITHQLTEAVK